MAIESTITFGTPTEKYVVNPIQPEWILDGNAIARLTLLSSSADGTASTFTQNFSDWYTPQQFSREFEAVAMAYRNFDDGTKDQRIFNLYAYPFTLNSAKTVKSITLPNNPDVVVLAATLVK